MAYKPRPFAECLDALRELEPLGKRKSPPKKQSIENVRAEVWSRESVGKGANGKVLEALFLFDENAMKHQRARLLKDPSHSLDLSGLGWTIPQWNAVDQAANWAADPGKWIVVRADLLREDADDFEEPTSVTVALWRVQEGTAVMVTEDAHGAERVPAVMGLAWPAKWKSARVWFGE